MFVALYVQVFYLIAFLENRKSLVKNIRGQDIKEKIKKYPSVSFLVACYNEEKTIGKTIEALLSLNYEKDKVKIIVIDDGSTDNTFQEIQRYEMHPNIVLLKKENGGKTSALNFGLKYADTELVASVDADTYLPENALEDIVRYFIRSPKTMAVGASTIIHNPKTIVQLAQSAEYNLFIFTKKMLASFGGALVLPGAFSIYKRQVFETIGGYKNGHNLEDLELTYRMQTNGFKVEHAHDVFAYTSAPSSVKQLFKQRLRWSHGFLNNTIDYRKAILNKKYGNFGLFTIPTAIVAHFVILYFFFYGLYRMTLGIIEKVVEINTVGFSNMFHGALTFDFFKIDTRATALFTVVLFLSVIAYIFMGRYFAKSSKSSYPSVFYFFLLYNFLAPLWVIKAIYSTVTSSKVAWR